MSDRDPELEGLLEAEREACERYERLAGPQLPIADRVVIRAARELCEEASRAVERYMEQLRGRR